jgi:hypothetical protein
MIQYSATPTRRRQAFCEGGDYWIPAFAGMTAYIRDNLDEALLFDFATARDHELERLTHTGMTADHREAVRAFIERRKAVFRETSSDAAVGRHAAA